MYPDGIYAYILIVYSLKGFGLYIDFNLDGHPIFVSVKNKSMG